MDLKALQENWDKFGAEDPLWGILAWPDKREQRWQIDEFFATGEKEIAEVLAYVEGLGLPLQRGAALDFGCGVGRLSQALTRRFQHVHGVDISPAMIELARQYNQFGERCQYHLNQAADLRLFGAATFDFIYSNITLQHMQPRFARGYLIEFLRLLAPGGILLFQIPSRPRQRWRQLIQPFKRTGLFRRYQRLRYGDRPIMEMYGLPRPQVERLLAAQGARLAAVAADDSADVHWQSFRYCVTVADPRSSTSQRS